MSVSSREDLDAATVVLLVLGAVVLLPVLMMGLGFAGMMGYGGMMGGAGDAGNAVTWWPLIGLLVQVVLPLSVLAGGYLVFRRVTGLTESRDPASEELRTAYARGELTDEQFETRWEKLNRRE